VEAPGGDQVMFMWEDGYAVFFGGGGKLNGLRRGESGWKDASASFDLDRENCTITFKRS
jgi:hypothetical protein